jgi:basic amino acid/polyamine antiporter, APA family
MGIMRTKSIEQSIRDTEDPEFQLRKALGPLDLTLFGIGVIIGTGLFILTGEAAAGYAGPAVALSYVVGGIVCALAALCYAEFASTVPVAGSAYTFSYASLGEFVAWLIGWDLILEFTLGAATVAKGWAGYFVSVLEIIGIKLPTWLYAAPGGGGLPRFNIADRDSARDDHLGYRDKIELSVQLGDHSDQDPRYAVHHRLRDILHKDV